MGIYSITSSNPTLADDISCIALSPAAIQNILTTAFKYSSNWRFKFNAGKSSVLRFTPSPPHKDSPVTWFLCTEPVCLSNTYNHLGIHLHSKLVHTEKIANACRKGRQAYFALKIREHLNPDTISRLYTRVALPSTMYGCELWYDLRKKRSARSEHSSAFYLQTCSWSPKEYQIRHMRITPWASPNNI